MGTEPEIPDCKKYIRYPREPEWRKNMNHTQMRTFVLTALFIAMILLLGYTPIGMIPLGFIYISLLAIPVVIGTLMLGLKTGLILGACFGIVSALKAFGITGAPSSLVAPLTAASPLLSLVMSLLPRLLVPVTAYLAHRLLKKSARTEKIAVPAAAVAGSLTNTIFYLGMMLLFYTLMGVDSAPVMSLITGTGLIAGSGEAIANALISTAVIAALQKMQHS